ncbi:hypothetical protein ABVK25_006740 [Lepraria finkii]|uniref:Uncharacterized protein n=1 Tax=Lepraria finkii TaxID=1340010 RepID=A0ABR4B6Q0_9LECA
MTYEERVQLVQQNANQLAEDERKAAGFLESSKAEDMTADTMRAENLDFQGRAVAAKAPTQGVNPWGIYNSESDVDLKHK